MRDERDDLLASESVIQAEEGGQPAPPVPAGTKHDVDVCGGGIQSRL
jgi:hypothetical protein